MPSFWSFITNDKYAVGCTRQTVYVYDNSNNELARFKDMKYAYTPIFCPGHSIFIVKSTEGNIAVYSLDKMKLAKKFRFSKRDAAQDDGFCFSKNGEYFYNIERHIDDRTTCLSIYETSNFSRVSQLFLLEPFELCHIEYDDIKSGLFVLGYRFKEKQSHMDCFVAAFEDSGLKNITEITPEKYEYALGYKRLEIMGFTEKAKKWSIFSYKSPARATDKAYDLEKLEHIMLSDMVCTV